MSKVGWNKYRVEFFDRGTGDLVCTLKHVPNDDVKSIMAYYRDDSRFGLNDVPKALFDCVVFIHRELDEKGERND